MLTAVACIFSAHTDESISQVDILNQQLDDLVETGHQREAISPAKKIIAISTELHGVSHVSVGRSQFQLAELYWAQGQYREADTPYKLALWIFEQRLPPASPETEQVTMRLVNSYSEQNLWQQVNILLLHWFDVTKQALGPDAPQTVQAMKNLAAFYRKTHRDTEADSLERQISSVGK
jgi:tetratricopeptide (TPR) repeat protein